MNRVTIKGFLGRDPETRYMPSGDAVTNFSVATSEKWKDKASGEQKERTEWHRCSSFGRTAEVIAEYFKKGSQILLEGSLHTREYEKDGIKRYSTEIRVDRFYFCDRASSDAAPRDTGDRGGGGEQRQGNLGDQRQQRQPAGDSKRPAGKFDDMEDYIPF